MWNTNADLKCEMLCYVGSLKYNIHSVFTFQIIKKTHILSSNSVCPSSLLKNILFIFSGDFFWQTRCAFGIMAKCWQSLPHDSKHGGAFSIYRARLFPLEPLQKTGSEQSNCDLSAVTRDLIAAYVVQICQLNVSRKNTSERLKIFNDADGAHPLLVDPFHSACFPLFLPPLLSTRTLSYPLW